MTKMLPHSDWISDTAPNPLPEWQRQGESAADFQKRWPVEFAAWQATQAEWAERHRAEHGVPEGMSVDLACGVGGYDGNGNPKGSGWW